MYSNTLDCAGTEWREAANGAGSRSASSPLPQQLQHRPGVPQEQAGKDIVDVLVIETASQFHFFHMACWVSIYLKQGLFQ